MTIRTKLTATESFKLYEFTRDNYVNLKQNDIEFAETAYKAIEPKTHVVITANHVVTARKIFGIESTLKTRAKENLSSDAKHKRNLRSLEERIIALEARMDRWEK